MAIQYSVKEGEHLCKIAVDHGFQDYRSIWKHANNATLAGQRKSPNILFPGDSVYIPDKQIKKEKAPTEKVHKYKLSSPILKLRIAIKDFDNQAMPNVDCEMEVEGTVYKIKSDAQGLIEHEIPLTAQKGKLRIPSLGIEAPLKIGYLQPYDKDAGCKARLINLGYHEGGDDALRLRYAIEEFQLEHNLDRTGEFDDATKAKLKEVHGC